MAEFLSRASIRAPLISPDARSVAYLRRETDWKEDEFISQLWLANVETGKSIQLTRGKKSVGSVEWSPDGRWLAFITERELHVIEPPTPEHKDREEKKDGQRESADSSKPAAKQIWLIAPDGGEAWPLTKSETNVGEFHWTKDGKAIVFAAAEPASKASKARKERYSAYDVVEKDYEQQQLWRVDAGAGIRSAGPQAAIQLTFDKQLNINSFAISPDSTRIAFSAGRNPLMAFLKDEDIYLLVLSEAGSTAGPVSKIVALPGPDRSPMFSPDGKQLVFATSLDQPKFFYANTHLAAVDLDTVSKKPATGAADVRDLTKAFDEDPNAI
ncbi:MAG TPA: DPP IV N-terminal domain-containing protein, partial [Steroidobacteraceae bacterium]|nr:DPP IV N-terminal domain-containing protein [Steroidobacteraceae bacterium]